MGFCGRSQLWDGSSLVEVEEEGGGDLEGGAFSRCEVDGKIGLVVALPIGSHAFSD